VRRAAHWFATSCGGQVGARGISRRYGHHRDVRDDDGCSAPDGTHVYIDLSPRECRQTQYVSNTLVDLRDTLLERQPRGPHCDLAYSDAPGRDVANLRDGGRWQYCLEHDHQGSQDDCCRDSLRRCTQAPCHLRIPAPLGHEADIESRHEYSTFPRC